MRKSALSFIFIFVLSFSLGYSAEKSPYKIGVNFELTGPWAEITETLRNTMVLGVEGINQRGGINGKPLELIFEDNGFEAGRDAANMTKFTKDPEVPLVVGPFEDTLQASHFLWNLAQSLFVLIAAFLSFSSCIFFPIIPILERPWRQVPPILWVRIFVGF